MRKQLACFLTDLRRIEAGSVKRKNQLTHTSSSLLFLIAHNMYSQRLIHQRICQKLLLSTTDCVATAVPTAATGMVCMCMCMSMSMCMCSIA